MTKHNHQTQDFTTLAADARALMSATADVAGAKVSEARNRLATALESAKDMAGNVRAKTLAHAKKADRVVRNNPYKAIAIGLGAGLLVGSLLASRRARKSV